MLLELKTYTYEINLELEGKFKKAFEYNKYDLMEKYAPFLLASIKTGSINPRIVDDDIVELWKTRAQEELKWGREHDYDKVYW